MIFSSIINFFKNNEQKIVIVVGGILIAVLSFGVGRLSMIQKDSKNQKFVYEKNQNICKQEEKKVVQENENQVVGKKTENPGETIRGNFVASKNSTKYHLPSCQFAKRIKPENITWFQSKEEAEKNGRSPCSTCLK